MANNENNRKPIPRVAWYDGINPTNEDFQAEQDGELLHVADIVQDFHGSGILEKNPVILPPILDTAKPNPSNISYATIGSGQYDGCGIFIDRQPIDPIFGDQLLISVNDVIIPLYSPLKVIIFGKIYDPTLPQGRAVLETLTFGMSGQKATYNYFKSVVAVFFNNFSGGIGRTDLVSSAATSLNTSLPGQKGQITIREVGPLQVFDHSVILNQTDAPNVDVRDFITSTITRTFKDELTFVINTAQNTLYTPVSLDDINELPLNTSGIPTKPFLDNTTNGIIYGQKIYITTDNIQQLSFSLSLADDAYGWSGELVLGIRPLQTKSINEFANKVDLDPDVNILFEASFTKNDLLDYGYVLTKIPQEIKFNFIGTALAQPHGILQSDQYYVITLTRRADTTTGKIFIEAGPKVLSNSKLTYFNPSTKAWTDDSQIDLWFKVYSAAIRVSSGIAYTTDGTMVSIQKTTTDINGAIISTIAGPYSLAAIDAVAADNIVLLQSTQAFEDKGQHPRTGNLVYRRVFDQATVTVLNAADFNTLVSATNNINQSNFPIVLAVINDYNNKSNVLFAGVITFPGQVRKNQIILFNSGLQDNILDVNNIIIPNNAASGVKYRIVNSETTTQYLGDFNNDKIFTSSDLTNQAVIQDVFSAQSTNTYTGTSFDPYSIFDTRSRDILGFGKDTLEDFALADVNGHLVINADDVARLQYLTTTLPAFVTPAPTTINIQVLTLENTTSINNPILVAQITNLDGYATATFPDQLKFTALNVGDMRALSLGDRIELSADGYTNTDGTYVNAAYSNLKLKKFIQRNDLMIETRFQSDVIPVIDTSYVLSFYSQNPVFSGKLGIFGETATEVLEFVAPGTDLITSNIVSGDLVKITGDLLGQSRNGIYTVSQVINASTFRIFSPVLALTAGVANAGIEFFASDGMTDKLSDIAVVQFSINGINLIASNIQEGDVLHITLGPVALNGTYTIARVISSNVFTVVPPFIPLIAQSFSGTLEFRAAGDVIIKISPTSVIGINLVNGPTPRPVLNMETLAPAFLPNGIDTLFEFSLTHVPVTGSVNVHWINNGTVLTMTYNASPVEIIGDGNPAGSSINRIDGDIILDTFLPPDAGTDITIDYRIAPVVTLKHCYPTAINQVSLTQTDIEFGVPFINAVSNTDIQGITGSPYVIIQSNNADPPSIVTDGAGNVIAGAVMANTINATPITLPSRNVVLQLTTAGGVIPNITAGSYWMQVYSGERVNIPAIQKEFLSDTISLSSPIRWTIQKNNFEWAASNMVITDYRRFLPAAFVSKLEGAQYTSKNEMWIPSDIYVGNGEILSEPGKPYHGDIEISKINLDLPVTALLSNSINIYNNLIASYGPTPGFTRGGKLAMKFSNGSYVGADDNGTDTALTRNQIRVMPTIGSLYLDGYQIPNADVYTDLDEVLTKLHYEIRSGTYYDDNSGILYFHMQNIKSIFENEPILQTGICRVVLDVALKKSGFANPVVNVNSTDILRLFTTPLAIIPVARYSISGEILAGFTVGMSSDNPDG